MAKAKKLPSGSWRVNQYAGKGNDGKRIYKSFTADTKKEAEYMAAEYVMSNKQPNKNEEIKLKEAIESYIEIKSNILSPSTIRTYRSILKNHFQSLMETKLGKITNDAIQAEINKQTAKIAYKTIRNNYSLIYTVIKYYLPSTIFKMQFPQKSKTVMRIPTKEEVGLILSFTHGTAMEVPIALGAGLGLRKSEILALRWSSVNFDTSVIKITSAIVLGEGQKLYEKAPKSVAGNREIVAPAFVIDALKRNKHDNEFICTVPESILYDKFIDILDKLGIQRFRFHDLRHYYASVMLSLGVPDKYAMERMGHSTNTMLKEVYQHTMENKHKEISDNINSYFEETMQHEMQHEQQKNR